MCVLIAETAIYVWTNVAAKVSTLNLKKNKQVITDSGVGWPQFWILLWCF